MKIEDKFVHPEIQDGEKFRGNYTVEDFNLIGWESKRIENQAYNKRTGEKLPVYKRLFPVFVSVKELEKCLPKYGGPQ